MTGEYAVRGEGFQSQNQTIYVDWPFNQNILGYQFHPATLRYARVDVATGLNQLTAPTKESVIWGLEEPVFVPRQLTGCYPLFTTFHARGWMFGEGTDEEDDRHGILWHELHHVDAISLETIETELLMTVGRQPINLVADDIGRVYVGFDSAPRVFEA